MPEKEVKSPYPVTAKRPPREWMWPFFLMVLMALGVLGYWGTSIFAPTETLLTPAPTQALTIVAAANSPTPVRLTTIRSVATNTPTRQIAAQPTIAQPAEVAAIIPPVLAADYQLTILHTNDVRGYLDPCG